VVTEWGEDLCDYIHESSDCATRVITLQDARLGIDGNSRDVFLSTKRATSVRAAEASPAETLVAKPVSLLAFYLPQFHPIPENDAWWGKGFTDWSNVAPCQPRFRGHYQPRMPGELGSYDLRVAETREAQAQLARAHGIEGFVYYHYWFEGRRLLDQPFRQVLDSGQPDFPFCLCWANENWTRRWDGRHRSVLLAQTYNGDDDRRHGEWLMTAFADPRYIKVDGRPLFLVYRGAGLPDPRRTTDLWREQAARLGLPGLFLCRVESFPDEVSDPTALGFDAAVEFQPDWATLDAVSQGHVRHRLRALSRRLGMRGDRIVDYGAVVDAMLAKPPPPYLRFPCVTPSWDNSARRPRGATILTNSTPNAYQRWLTETVSRVLTARVQQKLVFINAWNEWAEGNYLEPDRRFGRGYLEATSRALASGAVSQDSG
jgi:lipopolysaccharide biosynthesis protein